jgi:putative membrane protein insertion efficiency factor
VSALRRRLKRPETWLLLWLAVVAAFAADSFRQPSHQVSVRLHVGAVHLYQRFGRPVLRGYVTCRYRPTCSEYSIQAVEKYGIRRGLVMTIRRIASCTRSVAPGTVDPV